MVGKVEVLKSASY